MSSLFESSYDPLESTEGFDYNSGYGLVDAAEAVAQALGQNPLPQVTDTGGDNWGLDMINVPEVWQAGYKGKDVVVAVIDSGVDYTHPDLDDNIWVNQGEIANNGIDDDRNGYVDDTHGFDMVDKDNNPQDETSVMNPGHGTHVAGTIAAEDNGFGVTGVAPEAKIMPIRVMDENGTGSDIDVAEGIRYAADNGADVINLSLGGGSPSLEMQEAIAYAESKGCVVVMAAGNEGMPFPSFPASSATETGIAVGAVDSQELMPGFSNRAGFIPLDYVVAPGAEVVSTVPGGGYMALDGTSMAAPHVAGVVALVLDANPDLTPDEVKAIFRDTADPLQPFT